jgi:DNA primase
MLIEKGEIERVKRANDLVELVRGRGIELKRKGKQLVGKCPFHADHEPSLVVDPKKQLWNCLGACREGGDVYKFVMKLDGLDFRSAHLRLGGRDLPTPGNGARSSTPASICCNHPHEQDGYSPPRSGRSVPLHSR